VRTRLVEWLGAGLTHDCALTLKSLGARGWVSPLFIRVAWLENA
jgi:hypothetical protein